MVHNDITLQHRIDKFLARKYEELPELEQSVDDVYRQLLQEEAREERNNRFSKVSFGAAVQERALHKVRRPHHYGGLHLAV
jgi:hypothetical protein